MTVSIKEPLDKVKELEQLFLQAALIAGLGADSRKIALEVSQSLIDNPVEEGEERTCIDAGWPIMFSLRVPSEGGELCINRRLPSDAPETSMQRWVRSAFFHGGEEGRQLTDTFHRKSQEAWQKALKIANQCGAGAYFQQIHATVGPYGHLLHVNRCDSGLPESTTITWKIDRGIDPGKVLDACRQGDTWDQTRAVLKQLFGFHVTHHAGPWSINFNLSESDPEVRVGTTRWALGPEDENKLKRFAQLIDSLGGNRRFAEGFYKLLLQRSQRASNHRVGRAVEVVSRGGKVAGAEFYLTVVI